MATEPFVIVDAEGCEVKTTLSPIPDELQAEFDAWGNLGDEAWNLIAKWEKQR
jgi:hypothetical protein